VQLLHALKPNDKPQRKEFAVSLLDFFNEDGHFHKRVCFSDEANFQVSGKLNRYNVRIWGSELLHETREFQRDSPKVKVWCAIMHNCITGPFFFSEKTISSDIYLNILREFVVPQLESLQPTIIYQQDGAPPFWGQAFRQFLSETFPNRWIGRGGPILWPPRSPDITPMDFLLWRYVKDIVYKTKFRDINDLKERITDAIATVDKAMLERKWMEIEHRFDVLRATNGAHVEVF
jgi:hypothetical protein